MTDASSPMPDRSWYFRGFRDAIGLPAIMLMATMLGIGGLVRDIGFPIWVGTLSTLLVWAGPAQVILFGSLASGGALPAIAFAIWLSSARFLPMTISILPLVRTERTPWWQMALAAHLVSLTTWVEGQRRLPSLPREGRMPYFLGFATVIIVSGIVSTHGGYYLYGALPKPLAAGLLFVSPIFFAAAMVAQARIFADWLALGIGFFAAPVVVAMTDSGFDLLIVGVGGGSIAYGVRRLTGEKASDPGGGA